MHMADALLSPEVGGACWAVSGGLLALSARKLRRSGAGGEAAPLMGVLGAFVFSAQMINLALPGTGSSVHLTGGLLLAVLLGPYGGFLAMACVLAVQALVFADGGILAYGGNLLNMGAVPCFMVYPLIYRPLARRGGGRRTAAAVLSGIAALGAGALGVVAETTASGLTDLSFPSFLGLMEAVHLPLGVVEGILTAGVVSFLARARPDLLSAGEEDGAAAHRRGWGAVPAALLLAAFLAGGVLSGFASTRPDGLAWSLERLTGSTDPRNPAKEGKLHAVLGGLQEKTALFPDYTFPASGEGEGGKGGGRPGGEAPAGEKAPSPGTGPEVSVAGLVGCGLVLALSTLAAFLLRPRGGGGP